MFLGRIGEINKELFFLIYNLGNKNFLIVDIAIFFAKQLPFLMIFILLYLIIFDYLKYKNKKLLFKHKLFFILEIILAIILSRGVIVEAIHFFVPLSRPVDVLNIKSFMVANGLAFPSGHAAFLFALSSILFFWDKKMGIIYFILSLFNGLARILVGVHWPLDILGGILIGILSGILIEILLKKEKKALFFIEQRNNFKIE